MTVEHRIDLACHPSTQHDAVRSMRVQVRVRRLAGAELQLTFRLDGKISQVLIPPPGVTRIGIELWRHTCFEAFIKREGQPAYHELNFAPSSEWDVYAFRGYRDGGPVADETMRPHIAVQSTETQLELDAIIQLDSLSADYPRASLRLGLSAVIETIDGFSYWALRHPLDKPDFHNASGFALPL
jgi:hypothetical protein